MKSLPAVAVAFACGICLSACDKQDPAPGRQTRVQPSPTPKVEPDAGTDRLKIKALGAIAAVENYLVGQNPKLREKFTRDKAKWREKLTKEQKDLRPQIDRLREQLGKLDTTENRAQLRTELARLEDLSKDADKKLTALEAAGQEGWKSFKAQLKAEEAKNSAPSPTP